MITETETAFLAVVRAFLTEEKAALEELAALTEKQWNHLYHITDLTDPDAAVKKVLEAVTEKIEKMMRFF